ncbi:MAG: alpha/beta hydrolase, partial [Rubrobacteraceae bacterium]|nr:alpha/beta hydrolase [Rubrobacteraceae bacterium]
MFEGFERERVTTSEAEVELVRGGDGPPVLLLHGYPQTHSMWHLVAPGLAEDFTVVATDLRGYGDSSKPFGEEDHSTYSKRAMAADQASVMEALGFDTFAVVGHDRGGRVGHRMALDYPGHVTKLAVLDIVPTRHVFETVGNDLATAYYHWFFLIQPYDLPETLIGGNPSYYLHKKLGSWGSSLDKFAPEALAEYERCFDAATIHASCEDYRAASSIDLVHDEKDREEGRKIECPLLTLWGGRGVMEKTYDVEA